MIKSNTILKELRKEDLQDFIKDMQQAFSLAVKEKFGNDEQIPQEIEIKTAYEAKNTKSYSIFNKNEKVGGIMVSINEKTNNNSLDFFFISPKYHNCGFGISAWQQIENKFPDTKVWQTVTPYFEQRNIYFYVNKCGFHVVEVFKEKDMNKDMYEDMYSLFFRFEKVMK